MAAEFVDRPLPSLLDHLCEETGEDVVFVNPSKRMIGALAEWGVEHAETFPRMQLLAEEWTLKDALGQFTVASRLADLIAIDALDVRYTTNPPKTAMAVDSKRLIVVIDGRERYGALVVDDPDFVAPMFTNARAWFDAAEPYSLHTPPLSRIERTLEERLGADRREDFAALVGESVHYDGQIDEVVISLLVASKNQDLLYDISKWGEDIGLASKATFSRKKTELEQGGLIDTEKEPIEVGRPRLRLKFADPSLDDAPVSDLIRRTSDALGRI